MSKEAMKLALDALEDFEDAIRYDNEQDDIGARVCCDVLSYNPHTKDCKALKAITALREALVEQPAKQDIPDLIAGTLGVSRGTAYDLMREALAQERSSDEQPAQRKPLTDEQIHEIYDAVARQEPYMGAVTRRNIVRAIEAAHGITGETK